MRGSKGKCLLEGKFFEENGAKEVEATKGVDRTTRRVEAESEYEDSDEEIHTPTGKW